MNRLTGACRGAGLWGPLLPRFVSTSSAPPLLALDTVRSDTLGTKNEPATWVWLHGVLGQGRNWKSFGKRFASLAEAKLNRPVVCKLVDLRCHGDSARVEGLREGPHTLKEAAKDVIETIQAEIGREGGSFDGFVGHSLGGKVVLSALDELKGRNNTLLPKSAWVLDSMPNAAQGELVGDTESILERLAGVDLGKFEKQSQVIDHLTSSLGMSAPIAQWICSSLDTSKGAGHLKWKFNLEGCRDLFRDFKTRDLIPVVRDPPGGTAIHFVKAERSARLGSVQDELLALSEDPRHSLTFHVLEKAGHWLHVDNPSGLVKLMISTL